MSAESTHPEVATRPAGGEAWSDAVARNDLARRPWWRRLWPSRTANAEHAKYAETVARLERAVHGSTDGLWEWEFDTGRVWIMPQLAAMLGRTVEALPKQIDDWWDEIHPDDLVGVQDAIYRHRDYGDPYERQFRIRTATGAYRWFRARGLAYRDETGKALVMAGSICDVDELFQTQLALRDKESQLFQQQKVDAMGTLVGGVAHEFNNLLQAIRGYASFAHEAAHDPQQESDLQQVLDTCDRAATFTRQLLDFSRKGSSELRPCLCETLLSSLQSLLKPLLPPGIELTVQDDAAHRTVRANEGLLQQAMLNLCLNACDAMPEGGRLLVRSEWHRATARNAEVDSRLKPGDYVRILVTDTGRGVPADAAAQLFQPFFTTKEPGKGTGLGLSTAADIVTQCGGWMDYYSKPGRGATFRIYLPACEDEPPLEDEAETHEPIRFDATVLLAEDDAAAAEVGRRMLANAGCRVIQASTGDEAVEIFRERLFEIDAVVLDVALSGMSGRVALDEIRDVAPDVPVCICTGYDPAASQFDAMRAAGCCIVEKPFDEQRLLVALGAAIEAAHKSERGEWQELKTSQPVQADALA
jgi:two-component system cell cycle sensor histidine kinase/response regulator CckA